MRSGLGLLTRRRFLGSAAAIAVSSVLPTACLRHLQPAEAPKDAFLDEAFVFDGVLGIERRDCRCAPTGVGEIKRLTGINAAAPSVNASRSANPALWISWRTDVYLITTAAHLDSITTSGRFGVISYDQNVRGANLGSSVGPLALVIRT